MFELFTKICLSTENIHTFNIVYLVLGMTVNCLAVWIDSVLAQFCAILARFVQFCTSLSPKKCLLTGYVTSSMVYLVLGTTVNCLAVWIDSILLSFVQFWHDLCNFALPSRQRNVCSRVTSRQACHV